MNTNEKTNYNKTMIACYLGFITQAITANFTPLLFLTFHKTYGISMGKIALISLVFFFTQLVVDFLCAKFADKLGYRNCVIASEVTAGAGLIGMAFLPDLLSDPFVGILLCVMMYAIGSGLIEVLCSPIVEACPFEHKDAVMSTLHSFYCWGTVGVVILSTIFFQIFGVENWRILACLWAIIPLCNIFNFATCPIVPITEEGEGMSIKGLFSTPIFWIAIMLMIFSGASELSMSQWASAFAEDALGLSKTIGDLTGPCMFAIMMGICRSFYGKYGEKINLMKFMIGLSIMALGCYLVAGISNIPILGLSGCVLCGLAVGIMWPGTISLSSNALPKGGTAMFALLAMAGDFGGSVGPVLIGQVAQNYGDNLKLGVLAGSIFPALLVVFLFVMKKMKKICKNPNL